MGYKSILFALLLAVAAILVAIDTQKEKHYIFDQDVLQQVALEAIESTSNTKDLFDHIARSLAEKYPGHVETEPECNFFFIFFILFITFNP